MKWIFVIVVSLIQLNRISCESNEILSPIDCASGESVWCQSLGSATDCKATEHCFQNVWSKNWQLAGKEKSCVMCHVMMDEVKSTLQVDEYGSSSPIALIDNEKVCSMARLCTIEENSEQSDSYVLAQKKPAKKTVKNIKKKLDEWTKRAPYCDLCHSIFNVIGDFIDHHHSMVEQLLRYLCGLLGHAFGNVCIKYTNTYGPVGMSVISSYLHHQICSSIHICAYNRHASINIFTQTNQPNQISPMNCNTCSEGMNLIQEALSKDNAVENFKNFAATECMKYEGQENGCIELLHGQADALHSLLLKHISENESCTKTCLT